MYTDLHRDSRRQHREVASSRCRPTERSATGLPPSSDTRAHRAVVRLMPDCGGEVVLAAAPVGRGAVVVQARVVRANPPLVDAPFLDLLTDECTWLYAELDGRRLHVVVPTTQQPS